jgi:beta-lactamase regulating signal transducer with metallopeptidase domain
MDTLLQIGLSNAVVATLLALVLGCVGLVWRRPALLHCLWLLVLLKLVTPPLLWIPVHWPAPPTPTAAPAAPAVAPPTDADPAATPAVISQSPATADPESDPLVMEPDGAFEEPPIPLHLAALRAEDVVQPAKPPPPAPTPAWWVEWWQPAILAVWLTGSALWFLCALRRLVGFQRLLRHARLAPLSLQKQTQRLARKLGMNWAPTVYLVPGRLSPLVWAAFGRPRLVLPAALLEHVDDEQRATLILHELAHLRRRDHWVRALEFVVMGLYWWHPVVWYARRELREAEELCCDAWVVSSLPEANRTYATALVETIDFLSAVRSPVPLLASGVGPISDLKRRLTMIMHGTTPRTLSWRGMVLVFGLGAFLLPLLPEFLPSFASAQDKGADDKAIELRGRLIELKNALGDPSDGQPESADLAKLKAQLAMKLKEIQDTEARIRAIRAQLREVGGDGREETHDRVAYRLRFEAAKGGEPQEIILRKVGGKWEVVDPKSVAGHDVETIVVPSRLHMAGVGDIWRKSVVVPRDDKRATVPPEAVPVLPGRVDADRRIDAMEKKLEKILQRIEQLQKELKGSGGRPPMIDRGFFPNQDPAVVPPVIDRGFGPPGDGGLERPVRPGRGPAVPPSSTPPPGL